MTVLSTERLTIRELTLDDAEFIFGLVNEPSWLEHIGDRGVRTLDDARGYLTNGPLAMYARHGYGLWRVERREDGAVVGICGLLKRDTLPDADIGFAFLPAYWSQGYAREAARATLDHGFSALGMPRIAAIVSRHNAASIRLLERLGLRYERALVDPPGKDGNTLLYVRESSPHAGPARFD